MKSSDEWGIGFDANDRRALTGGKDYNLKTTAPSQLWVNGIEPSYTLTDTINNQSYRVIGANTSFSRNLQGPMQEILLTADEQNRVLLEQNINDHYNIY